MARKKVTRKTLEDEIEHLDRELADVVHERDCLGRDLLKCISIIVRLTRRTNPNKPPSDGGLCP